MKTLSLRSLPRPARRRGFTLVEIMIASAIAVAFSAMALWFMVQSTRTSMRTLSNIDNDLEQWSISNRLLIDSKLANGVAVFDSFATSSFTTAKGLGPGERGNFLVLSQSDPIAGSTQSQFISLWGYVYDSTNQRLSKFEYTVTAADRTAGTPLVDLLTNYYSQFVLRTVAENVTLVSTSGGEAFLVREQGRQANLVFRRQADTAKKKNANSKTVDYRMFEISFYTRK